LVDEGSDDVDALFHAGGERADSGVCPFVHADVGEEFVDAFLELGFGDVVESAEEGEVFSGGEVVVHDHFFADEADVGADLAVLGDDVEAGDGGGAVGGSGEGAEHADDGGFACAVGSEEAEDFAGHDLEADVVDGGEVAEHFLEVGDGDGGLAGLMVMRVVGGGCGGEDGFAGGFAGGAGDDDGFAGCAGDDFNGAAGGAFEVLGDGGLGGGHGGSLLFYFGADFGDVVAEEAEVLFHGLLVDEGDVVHVGVADDDEGIAFVDVEFSAETDGQDDLAAFADRGATVEFHFFHGNPI